jgi:hypothetical protein
LLFGQFGSNWFLSQNGKIVAPQQVLTGMVFHVIFRLKGGSRRGTAKKRRKDLSNLDPRLFEYAASLHTDLHVLDELVVMIDLAHMLFDLNRTLNGYHIDWLHWLNFGTGSNMPWIRIMMNTYSLLLSRTSTVTLFRMKKVYTCKCNVNWLASRFIDLKFIFKNLLDDIKSLISSIGMPQMHYVDFYTINVGANLRIFDGIRKKICLLINLKSPLFMWTYCAASWTIVALLTCLSLISLAELHLTFVRVIHQFRSVSPFAAF